jgi:hypothetical protein
MVLKLGHFGKSNSWTDRERNEEALQRAEEERNILQTIKRRTAKWIGHILRRNCLLKHIIEGRIEGRIEVTESRRRRRKKPLEDRKETRGHSKMKEEALEITQWKTRFGRGYGPPVRQTTE